nr:DUF3102 domain-containing protein [Desulfosporosinus meridiei]
MTYSQALILLGVPL